MLVVLVALPYLAIRPLCLQAIAYKLSLLSPDANPDHQKLALNFLDLPGILTVVCPLVGMTYPFCMLPGLVAVLGTAHWARRGQPLMAVSALAFASGLLLIAPWLYALYVILTGNAVGEVGR